MISITIDGYIAEFEEFLCEGTPKGAVIICPGGGYEHLSSRESGPVARAYAAAGYQAFVLWYEIEKEVLGDLPLRQLSRAVAYVKSHAAEYQLTEKKIYVCGFSAGGHLAGSLGVLWNRAEYFEEGLDLQSHKPDGMILCYSVITAGEYAHRGSFVRLAGEEREKQERYSLEKLVSADTVPAFLWGTASDTTVPVQNSLLMLDALSKYQVPMEYHLYPYGIHGLSLATEEVRQPEKQRFPDSHVARWFEESIHWMEEYMEGSGEEI